MQLKRRVMLTMLCALPAVATATEPAPRQNDVWLAGSLDFTEEEARKWSATMDALRNDGTIARIMHKYSAAGN